MKKTAIVLLAFMGVSFQVPLHAQAVTTTTAAISSAPTNSTNATGFLDEFYNTGSQTRTQDKPASAFWSVVKVVFFTALFAFLGYLIVKYVVSKNGVKGTSDDQYVDVIMTKSLGYGNFILLVQMGPAVYFLSMSGDGVRLLERIEDKEVLDYIELHKEDMRPKQKPFFDLLTVFPSLNKVDKLGFMKSQKDRLKKM